MSCAEHNFVRIGQVLKANGTSGEVIIGFRGIDLEDIDTEEPVFIFMEGTPVPFFIESLTRRGTGKAIARLSDICSAQEAEEITGQAVYTGYSPEGTEDEEDLTFLTGWVLYNATDKDNGPRPDDIPEGTVRIGTITDVLDIPGNPCIIAETKNGAVTVPLHEDLIKSLDPESRTIIMTIPEGLLSL